MVLETRFKVARISISADRTTAIVDPIVVSISVETLVGLAVALPRDEETMGPFRVLAEEGDAPAWAGKGYQRWERRYVLSVSAAGAQTIPALPVFVEDPDSLNYLACIRLRGCGDARPLGPIEMRRLRTRPLTVSVTSVLPADADPARPKDAAPPLALAKPGVPAGRYWLVLATLAAAALVAGLRWRRRRGRTAPSARLPAHEIVLAALRRLHDQWEDRALVEEFHARLSAILRNYLVGRFSLPASARTTEEIL